MDLRWRCFEVRVLDIIIFQHRGALSTGGLHSILDV